MQRAVGRRQRHLHGRARDQVGHTPAPAARWAPSMVRHGPSTPSSSSR